MSEEEAERRPTIHDVARHARVSAATVSKVLRGVQTVRQENADRVRAAVAALEYRMDPLASGLRNEHRRIVGAIVPELESAFFGALVTGLEQAAEAAGYQMIIASSRECEQREEALVARMHDWRVSGVVLVPVRSERGLGPKLLHKLGMQAVLVDRVSANDRFDTVTADNFEASAQVAERLIAQGHRQILLVGMTRISKAVRTRAEGFEGRARELDQEARVDKLLSDAEVEVQQSAVGTYLDTCSDAERPTAIFCLSQRATLMTLSELRRRGIRVPEEVALVGFDDAEWMKLTWPQITAVAQPVDAIADRAVATLLSRVIGETTGFPVQYLERCDIMVRQSAGPLESPKRSNRREG